MGGLKEREGEGEREREREREWGGGGGGGGAVQPSWTRSNIFIVPPDDIHKPIP